MANVHRVAKLDVNNNKRFDEDDKNKIKEDYLKAHKNDLSKPLEWRGTEYKNWTDFESTVLNPLLSDASSVPSPDTVAEANLSKTLNQLNNDAAQLSSIEEKIKQLEQSKTGAGANIENVKKQIEELNLRRTQLLENAKMRLQSAVAQARITGHTDKLEKILEMKDLMKKLDYTEQEIKELKQKAQSAGTVNMTMPQMRAAKGFDGAAKAQTASSGFTAPDAWGKQVGSQSLDFARSVIFQSQNLSALDEIFKNSQEGDRLMQLFYYFAQLASSGDMGAIYQFMKFITYVISKDKARQQIGMGEKLIELQASAREWTNKLMNTDSKDSDAFSKMMMQSKSETDAIATSQKLIAQMMEEFAQVVETLSNSTKAALEAQGRILRTVSSVR